MTDDNRDRVASFDYRELALQLDRPVVPLRYTSDMNEHVRRLAEQHANWLVASGAMSSKRGTLARTLVTYLRDRAELRFDDGTFQVYRLRPPLAAVDSS